MQYSDSDSVTNFWRGRLCFAAFEACGSEGVERLTNRAAASAALRSWPYRRINDRLFDVNLEKDVETFHELFGALEQELHTVIVGMDDVVRRVLTAIFAGGHILLEGVPGLGKTLLVKSVARTLNLSFKRIQFTPDLMPSDVTGTQVLSSAEGGARGFVFKPGPLFANIVLADEINRATPKTQAALLEAMEERQITALENTYQLPAPFFVLATQNPIELEGTYPLPEAQLDRFLMKLLVPAPSEAELKEILRRTTGAERREVRPLAEGAAMTQALDLMRGLVRRVAIADPLAAAIVRLISALTPASQYATAKTKKYVRFGPGPRGAQSVILVAKVQALLDRRMNVSFDDIKAALTPTLRHRLILSFDAEADGVTADDIIEELKRAK